MKQRTLVGWLFAFTCAAAVWACAGQSDDGEGGGATASGSTSNGGSVFLSGGGGAGATGATGTTLGTGNVTSIVDGKCQIVADPACSVEAYQSEQIGLDIYVMFDQSGSMCTCVNPPVLSPPIYCPDSRCMNTRLDAVKEALDLFMKDPESTGVGIGIGYFGYLPYGETSCNSAQYEVPDVTLGDLPEQASVIMASLNGRGPEGETPTGAAIEGACTYARQAATATRGKKVVVLLLTDGRPEAPITCSGSSISCCPTIADAEEKARACNGGTTPIPVYVLGVGPMVGNMDSLALAGGTKQAHIVSQDGDVAGLVNALNSIRADAALPCEYQPMPAPGETHIDYAKEPVTIKYADSACNGTAFARVTNQSSCMNGDGWYLDETTSPPTVRLCPTSCNLIQKGGSLLVMVGCRSVDILF